MPLDMGFGYWNGFVWLIFFLILGLALSILRFSIRKDFRKNAAQGDPCFVEENSDGESVFPASAFLSLVQVFPESLHLFLNRFLNVDASDGVGYFVCSALFVVLWLSLAG